MALDKTGTLTEGRPVLTDVVVLRDDMDAAGILTMAARAEADSEHPLARPIVEAAAEGLDISGMPSQTEPVPGKGIITELAGHRVIVGNLRLLAEEGIDAASATSVVDELASAGKTPVIIACGGEVLGVLAVADKVRDDAAEMVRRLHANGVRKVVMLTGDNQRVAAAVAAQVGVDEVRAACCRRTSWTSSSSCSVQATWWPWSMTV